MKNNKLLLLLKNILVKEKIEIVNLANEKENGCLLSFVYKGQICYITKTGLLCLDGLSEEDQLFIKKIIIYCQRTYKIETKLPMIVDESKLEKRQIDGMMFYQLMKIKNQGFYYRYNGIFGYIYLLCEQTQRGYGYSFSNLVYYQNILLAEEFFARRVELVIKAINCFTNDELKVLLYYIENYKIDKSKELTEKTENIKNKIVAILKEEEYG